jgi:mannose-6-phosphate isomerase-like protein (cupin superfamily)
VTRDPNALAVRELPYSALNLEVPLSMPDETASRYDTRLNVLYPPLKIIEAGQLAREATHPWYNQTLCEVNASVVRLGVVQGEYHWHHHESDEFFYVVDGALLVDTENGTLELHSGQALVVPRTVEHRPRAPQRTIVLMVENKEVRPTGD